MSEPIIIIGVDHGYAAMKTAHFSFHTGLVAHEHEPYTLNNVLEYGGTYYVVGSGRQPLQKDKTRTEDYYLLTLAAIAKELEHRGAEHTASIHLAAGLPLTSFGSKLNTVYDNGTWWSKDTPKADVVVPRWNSTPNYNEGTQFLYDGSYIRLKNVELSYTFQGDWLKDAADAVEKL